MKLTREGLKQKELWEAAGIALPGYDIEAVANETRKAPVWVHFGIGNIFRIFIGGIADRLLSEGEASKGITCVETFDFDVVDKIYDPYDNLVLGVTLEADGSTRKQVIGSLTEAIKAQTGIRENWERLRAIFTDPGFQMCSFTITEKGYALRGADGNLFPFVQADIDAGPAAEEALAYNSAMSIVAALLYERYKAGEYPVAVVSMDNCSHNGEKLKSSIVGVAKLWAEKAMVPEEFVAWLEDESQVGFPWSMIDKITPRPAESVQKELEKLGLEDMAPVITSKNTYIAPFVNAEGPQYLVIEDCFPNGRPALEKAGVYMTDRDTVNKVERMKVTTCLNPLHTALAVYGCLLGYTLIADEMKDPELNKLVHTIGLVEGMPVVTDPGILSPKDFVDEVINIRIPNPFMPDTPQRIATDTSQKVGIRYGETIKSYVEKDGSASCLEAIPLAIAGWLRYLIGVDDEGNAFERSSDPMLAELTADLEGLTLGAADQDIHGKLQPILSNANIFGSDLYAAGLGEKIEGMFAEEMAGPGAVRATLKKYCGEDLPQETDGGSGTDAAQDADPMTRGGLDMDMNQAGQVLNNGIAQAQELMKNPSKINDVLGAIQQKLKEVPMLSTTVADIPVMISMVKSYITKEYTEVSPKVIACLVGAFLYLIKKDDLVPDNIPILGIADDVAVIGLALKMCEPELNAYKAWKQQA